jgi:hypothetical protein
MKADWLRPIARGRRRGPLPGETERFGDSDRALFSEIECLMRGGKSLRAATIELVSADRVSGVGSPRGRAERPAARFRKGRPMNQPPS